jgi:Na+/melibiose symporter-like transporter
MGMEFFSKLGRILTGFENGKILTRFPFVSRIMECD